MFSFERDAGWLAPTAYSDRSIAKFAQLKSIARTARRQSSKTQQPTRQRSPGDGHAKDKNAQIQPYEIKEQSAMRPYRAFCYIDFACLKNDESNSRKEARDAAIA